MLTGMVSGFNLHFRACGWVVGGVGRYGKGNWADGVVFGGDVADTLDRCEVPIIGAVASRILDDE